MKASILFLISIVSSQILYGQVSNYTNVYHFRKYVIDLETPDLKSDIDIEGTPFLDSTFVEGSFLFGDTVYSLPLRYNVFLEAFEVKLDNESLYINSNLVDTIFYKNAYYVFKNEGLKQKVFQVLHRDDQAELLKKHTVHFIEGSSGVPFKEDVLPHFKNSIPDYYLFSTTTGLTRIVSFKDFNTIAPDKAEEIEVFIKKNKLKKKNEADLVKLFRFVVE